MRILHSIHSVNPAIGGPIEFIRQLIPLHDKSGDEATVACFDKPEQEFIQSFPGNLLTFGPAFTGYGYCQKYLSWLKQNKQHFDLVVVHGLWQYTGMATWQVLRGTSTPYVVFPHGMLDPWFKQAYPLKHLKKSAYWHIIEKHVLRDASAVLFTSEAEYLAASQTYRPFEFKKMVLTLGTASPSGNALEQKAQFLGKYPHLADKQIVLFLSRIHEKKGCDLLLKAFAEIASSNQSMHLVMAGPLDSPYAKGLKDKWSKSNLQISNKITWTGQLLGDLKWGSIHACDALILPSHQENFGVVVSEALSCGKPVLISNKVNIWKDILADGAALVENDDLLGTKNLLKRWIGLSNQERQKMKVSALKCFKSRYEINIAFEKFKSCLGSIISAENNAI